MKSETKGITCKELGLKTKRELISWSDQVSVDGLLKRVVYWPTKFSDWGSKTRTAKRHLVGEKVKQRGTFDITNTSQE